MSDNLKTANAPDVYTLEAFVEGVRFISGEENPAYFMEPGHDIVWVVGDNQPEKDSAAGKRLYALGFHYDSDGWAWFT